MELSITALCGDDHRVISIDSATASDLVKVTNHILSAFGFTDAAVLVNGHTLSHEDIVQAQR